MTIIILCIIILALFALCFWLWRKCRGERDRRWDEISRAAGLESELSGVKAAYIDEIATYRGSAAWYSRRIAELVEKNASMQDRLSALLCPHNAHVWRDGVCAKCGREEKKA